MESLFDRLSAARGGLTCLHRDPVLIGLLLGKDPDAIAARLTARATLPASGLFHFGSDGRLHLHRRLVVLSRAGTRPARNFYDQLLGIAAGSPPPWEAFAHLGREAEIVAALLREAMTRGESGVHVLLHGAPGTGKTSFAMALALHLGVRLRPVTEADDHDDEPSRAERLSGLRLAARIAPRGRTLLLFDEAEDLFVPFQGGAGG